MPGLDLIPSNIDLSGAEVQLVNEIAREQTLRRELEPVLDDYDIVLIDCQPSLGLLTVNALAAADGVMVPLECEYFALRGVAILLDIIRKVQDKINPQLEIEGILATMYDSRTLHAREVLARVVEVFGDQVFHTVIARTVRFPDTTVAGEPITSHATSSARRGRLPRAGPRARRPARPGCPMSRRVSLPGADELFRVTGREQEAAREAVAPDDAVAAPASRPAAAADLLRSTGRGAAGDLPRTDRGPEVDRRRIPTGARVVLVHPELAAERAPSRDDLVDRAAAGAQRGPSARARRRTVGPPAASGTTRRSPSTSRPRS